MTRLQGWKAVAIATTFCAVGLALASLGAAEQPNSNPLYPTDKAEFAYSVDFEQGATKFLDGDNITITEVCGTAETMTPGNIYWIKGTYTLASSDQANVGASITASKKEDGRSKVLKVQRVTVDKGEGTFMLFLPMYHEGWPHVSFYPANGGDGFGANYFGTGESVLQKLWGSGRTDRTDR